MRVEVLSLSLRPEGRLARDSGVVRLFVEFSLLDLPTEETPMSLPKPPPGRSINYNYSKGERPRTASRRPAPLHTMSIRRNPNRWLQACFRLSCLCL